MSEKISNSLVNLGDISKPADTLIKKIAKAVGGFYAPYQIKRLAKAEAEAALIRAQSQIEVTDLHRRAIHRFIEEEARRQKNMEDITAKALPQLEETAKPESVDDDWVTNFFDKSRIVSDGQMQELWARILAGEANCPGKYSKRTVNFLVDLDTTDAGLFRSLCSFAWIVGGITPLIFDCQAPIYNAKGLNFNTLTHLDSIGLIQFNNLSGFQRVDLPKALPVFYCSRPLLLTMEKDSNNRLPIGKVLLTKVGEELASVCRSPGVEGFFDYVKERWKKYLPDATETTEGAPRTEVNR
jgi:hypothetical protein